MLVMRWQLGDGDTYAFLSTILRVFIGYMLGFQDDIELYSVLAECARRCG